MKRFLEHRFGLAEHGTSVGTEVRAGVVTFLTMSYILFVNPQILSVSGMPAEDVAVATAIASAVATLMMGIVAGYPIALAPGMGLNAYFTYGVVAGMGVSWQTALAAVFIEGLLFLALALTGVRTALMRSLPDSVKVATMAGIGLFLATIGLVNAGLVVDHPATLVTLGDVRSPAALLALGGLLLMVALHSAGFRSSILVGILAVTGVAWIFGWAPAPEQFLTWPKLPEETFLALDFSELLTGKLILVVLAFLFVDMFDTAGTLLGIGRLGGFLDDRGELPRSNRALTTDATGTVVGALLGTSTVTSYVESATGIEEGGRSGLTAVVVSLLFLLSLFFTPVFIAVPAAATAPALILVGAMMMKSSGDIAWSRTDEAIPAFLTIVLMPLTYSIANGISAGILSFVGIRVLRGRFREVNPVLLVLTVLLTLYFALR